MGRGLRRHQGDERLPERVYTCVESNFICSMAWRLTKVSRNHRYTPREAARGIDALAEQLQPGAPLIEGSCSRNGDCGVAHVLRRTNDGLAREALLFTADVNRRRGFAPLALRPYLPRDLRWSFKEGSPVYEFWLRWTEAWKAVRRGDGDVFRAACGELRIRGDAVDWVDEGLMVWTPPGGVP